MVHDPNYPYGFFDMADKLEEDEKAEIYKMFYEHDAQKKAYEHHYFSQIDNYNMMNAKFKNSIRPITPHAESKRLDKILMEKGNALIARKKEAERKMQEERARRKAKDTKKKDEEITDPRRIAFRKEMKDIEEGKTTKATSPANQNEKAAERPKDEDSATDPRRLAFRKEMENLNEQNAKHKGLDKEL